MNNLGLYLILQSDTQEKNLQTCSKVRFITRKPLNIISNPLRANLIYIEQKLCTRILHFHFFLWW